MGRPAPDWTSPRSSCCGRCARRRTTCVAPPLPPSTCHRAGPDRKTGQVPRSTLPYSLERGSRPETPSRWSEILLAALVKALARRGAGGIDPTRHRYGPAQEIPPLYQLEAGARDAARLFHALHVAAPKRAPKRIGALIRTSARPDRTARARLRRSVSRHRAPEAMRTDETGAMSAPASPPSASCCRPLDELPTTIQREGRAGLPIAYIYCARTCWSIRGMKATLTCLSTAALLYIAACQSVEPDGARPVEDDQTLAALESDPDWRMALRDVTGSGFNPFESELGLDSVGRLEVKWIFDEATAGAPVQPIHATPVTSGSRIFVGSAGGVFYALDRDGALLWQFTADNANPIMSLLFSGGQSSSIPAPIVGGGAIPAGRPFVIFGDADGNIYCLQQETGELIWKVNVDAHPLGGVVGNSLLVFGSTVVIGIASIENAAFALPPGSAPCCTHRGGVAALDVDTGAELWRWEAVAESEVQPLAGAYLTLGFEF